MELDKIIELVKEKYEYANTQEWIMNPLAYALYQVWREVDSQKYEKKKEYNRLAQQKSRAKRKKEGEG